MHRTVTGILLCLTGAVAAAQPFFRVQTLAGSNFAGDGGPAAQAILKQAEGVAVHADGTIYIADAADHRIRAISPEGMIRTVAGDGNPGAGGDGGPAVNAQLNSPYGLALDRQGNLLVADLGNARIRRIDTSGNIQTVAGGGSIPAATTSEGSEATALQFKSPRNVLADPNGGFYFSDFDAHRVYFVDTRGVLSIFAGTGNPGYGADNIPAERSALRNPAGLAFEPQGGVVIVESGALRLRRVARGIATSYLTEALRAYPLYSPTGIAFDLAGNLYIADARATGALKRTPQGEVTALPLSGRAVAAHPAGGAVYAWNATVYRVDFANKLSLTAGSPSGAAEVTGDGSAAADARLESPAGLAYDKEGNLYIADEKAHRVRRVTPSGLITTFAGTGKPGYAGNGGLAAKAALHTPRGLAFDALGNLYIADSGNHAVRVVTPQGIISTFAGNGFSGYRGDNGPATAAMLNTPSAVAVEPSTGELFLADTANHRVRRVSRGGIIATVAGSGSPGMAFEGAAAILAQLNAPRGLAFDAAGNLYIADTANNRVRRVDPTGLLSTLTEPDFVAPLSVAVAPDGGLFVADTGHHRICRIVDGNIVNVAGAGTAGFSGDGGMAIEAQFQSPAALAFDANANLAVADSGNARVRQLKPQSLIISEVEQPVHVLNAATNAAGPIAPGMLATLLGEGFGPPVPVTASAPGPSGWPRLLGEVDVYIDGEAAPLLYVSANQVNLQIPYSIASKKEVRIEIHHRNAIRAKTIVPAAPAAPGLFPQIAQQDGTINSQVNPAIRGAIVSLFATGDGLLPLEAIEARIAGIGATVVWAGPAPGLPGILQLNVRVPSGFLPAGPHPVSVRFGGVESPAGPVVYLQ